MLKLVNHRWIVAATLMGAAICGCSSVGAGLKKQRDSAIAAASEQCKNDFAVPDLDPIRHKVELYRESPDAAVPFEIASNQAVPTDIELPVIARWATLRDECSRRVLQASTPSADASAMQSAFMRQRQFLYNQAGERISQLIVALHQKKLTYGEFAHKRHEVDRAVWMLATAVGDLAVMLPTRVAKEWDLYSGQHPLLF